MDKSFGVDYCVHLSGLPPRYRDSVRAITPGLPLFLYNYTTHQLHGIFEVCSSVHFTTISYSYVPRCLKLSIRTSNWSYPVSLFNILVKILILLNQDPVARKFFCTLYKFGRKIYKSEMFTSVHLFGDVSV